MANDSQHGPFIINGVYYSCSELHDAVALCYSQIVKATNVKNKCPLKKSVYAFYTEAMRKYRSVLKGGIN